MDIEDFLRSTPDELQHFGVKGMKWGRRKPSAKKLAKKDAKWEETFESKKDVTAAKAFNNAVPKMNALIKTHQAKGKNWTEDDPRWKPLEDEFGKEFGAALNSYLNKSPGSISPSGKKRVEAVIVDNLNFRIEVVDNQ